LDFFASGDATTETVLWKDLEANEVVTTGTKLLLIAASTPLSGVIAGGSFVDVRCCSLSLLGFWTRLFGFNFLKRSGTMIVCCCWLATTSDSYSAVTFPELESTASLCWSIAPPVNFWLLTNPKRKMNDNQFEPHDSRTMLLAVKNELFYVTIRTRIAIWK
jgi:hypothetical protein